MTNPSEAMWTQTDEDGLDRVQAIICDAASAEPSPMVHEGGQYYAERIIKRAIAQGTLCLADQQAATPAAPRAICESCSRIFATPAAPVQDDDALTERLTKILTERRLPGTRNGPITEPRELAQHIAEQLAATPAAPCKHEGSYDDPNTCYNCRQTIAKA